jgi:1-acyl-sn-glycerol-3-phosphate acyltransferase
VRQESAKVFDEGNSESEEPGRHEGFNDFPIHISRDCASTLNSQASHVTPHVAGLKMGMLKQAYLIVRSTFLWSISIVHFFIVCTFLVFLGIFVDPRWNDWPQRVFFRNILRLAGVNFEVKYAPGFDRERTSIFICNHTNLFDAFVVYSAIPQFVRGLELESHFRIPAYGWMMKRFGNIPVSSRGGPSQFKKTLERIRAHIKNGISVIIFAEGTRTLDGRVGPFQKGGFVIAHQIGASIVPMSICGSFQFNRKGSWMLRPSKITVYLHDTIETKDLQRQELGALVQRVHRIVAEPVEASLTKQT